MGKRSEVFRNKAWEVWRCEGWCANKGRTFTIFQCGDTELWKDDLQRFKSALAEHGQDTLGWPQKPRKEVPIIREVTAVCGWKVCQPYKGCWDLESTRQLSKRCFPAGTAAFPLGAWQLLPCTLGLMDHHKMKATWFATCGVFAAVMGGLLPRQGAPLWMDILTWPSGHLVHPSELGGLGTLSSTPSPSSLASRWQKDTRTTFFFHEPTREENCFSSLVGEGLQQLQWPDSWWGKLEFGWPPLAQVGSSSLALFFLTQVAGLRLIKWGSPYIISFCPKQEVALYISASTLRKNAGTSYLRSSQEHTLE